MATVVAGGLVVAALSGCSSSSSASSALVATPAPVASAAPETPSPEVAPPVEQNVGTGGELIAIQSSNVQAAGYDATTGTMTVLFESGGLYEYYDVPVGLWEDFVAAQPHPWSAVGYLRLVKGGIAYQRIG